MYHAREQVEAPDERNDRPNEVRGGARSSSLSETAEVTDKQNRK